MEASSQPSRTFAYFAPYRERAFRFAEERRTALLLVVTITTLCFASWSTLSAAPLWSGSAILSVVHYRDTLEFTSAVFGGGILLPFVNVMVVSQVAQWRRAVGAREIVGPLAFGLRSLLSVPLVFVVQLVNSNGGQGWQFDLGGLALVVAGPCCRIGGSSGRPEHYMLDSPRLHGAGGDNFAILSSSQTS